MTDPRAREIAEKYANENLIEECDRAVLAYGEERFADGLNAHGVEAHKTCTECDDQGYRRGIEEAQGKV